MVCFDLIEQGMHLHHLLNTGYGYVPPVNWLSYGKSHWFICKSYMNRSLSIAMLAFWGVMKIGNV